MMKMAKIKLSDICNPKQWKTIPTSDLLEEGYPVYGANGIIGYYSEFNHENPVVAVTCRGATCGSINITVPKAYVTGNAMCLDDVRSDIEMEYLYYCLKHYDFNNVISGSAQPQITRQGMDKIYITVCTHDEQISIVNKLKKVERVIELRKQELQSLDDLIKARFVELFGNIKEEQLLGEISEFVTVGIANSATHAYVESGVPMLRNQNIKENYLDDSDLIYIKPEFAAKYESKKLKENDIIAMRTGYPGVACLVPKKYEGCQTFTTLIVRLKENNNPSYVCSYINSDLGKRYIDSEKVGVAQQNVGAKSLAQMPIKIAPKELQDEYATFVKQVDKSKVV